MSTMRRSPEHYALISRMGVSARLKNKKPRNDKEFILARTLRVPCGCLEWTKYIHPSGYGYTSVRGRGFIAAHRMSYEAFVSEVPAGLCVLHKCDNRKCVDPDHLFLGTKSDNNSDRDSKSRQAIAGRIHTAKLSAPKVLEIRARFDAGATKKSLGARFGVTGKNIEAIVNRETWKHI